VALAAQSCRHLYLVRSAAKCTRARLLKPNSGARGSRSFGTAARRDPALTAAGFLSSQVATFDHTQPASQTVTSRQTATFSSLPPHSPVNYQCSRMGSCQQRSFSDYTTRPP